MNPTSTTGLSCSTLALSRGVQVLDPLETRGCVVAALAPFALMRWAVTTLDELGETVVELNITEFRGEAVALSDAERPSFAARAYYAEMLRRLHISAAVDARFFPSAEEKPMVGEDMDTEEIIAAYRGATDPGLRRSYVEVARRLGEVDGREELEMWALQEESR